ncbi:follicle-stimulating hormone receptor-like [Actinia tenebrosa]|uniref:Follicle-stimulating hormone receptor-like n=1 Tax=Actinia tenebrosa TaxID=6105 RepID=A0A6P8IBI5_ACTTE|nr:follicle-stimulating hormone receptor-like [Actinia tenebrosa]
MIMPPQMMTIFLSVYVSVVFSQASVMTQILPSQKATETTNSLTTKATTNISMSVKPTSVFVSPSFVRSLHIQSSRSTPFLLNLSNMKHTSFKTMFLKTASMRTTPTSFPAESMKFQISSFPDPPSSFNNGEKISDPQTSPSRVNSSDLIRDCPKGCFCKHCEEGEVEEDMIELKCRTNNLKKLLKKFDIPKQRICSLNLAQNDITELWKNVFRGFDKLRILILDDNKLQVLRKQIFFGLPSLQYLSIRHNDLRTWKGNLDLPRIKVLNLEGNKNFSFSTSLLKNTTLALIFGLSFSNSCKSCNMSRENASWSLIHPENGCNYIPQQYYPMAEELLSTFILFKGKCEMDKECKISLTDTKPLRNVYRNKCWEVIRMLRPVVLLLGILAIVFNTVVVMVIVATKPLRSSTTLLLISHMAFCDILIGAYAVAIGDGHSVVTESSYEFRQWRHNLCPYFRSIFVFGQVMEVATSLLVTTERYFAIVFCMNPSIRVNKKKSAIFLLLFWILASIFSYLLHVYDGSTITDNFMCIIVRNVKNYENTDMFYSQGMMLMLVAIYLVTMLQYCHIYIYVRRSTINAGVRRETKLASRICLMVFTSFVFFAFPNISMFVLTVGSAKFPLTPVQDTVLSKWLPPMFLVFNTCLNPILFAYRNEKFVRSVKNSIKNLRRVRLTSFHVGSRVTGQSRNQAVADENSRVHSNSMIILSVFEGSPRHTPQRPRRDKTSGKDFDVKQAGLLFKKKRQRLQNKRLFKFIQY